jgi:hypothetical protein
MAPIGLKSWWNPVTAVYLDIDIPRMFLSGDLPDGRVVPTTSEIFRAQDLWIRAELMGPLTMLATYLDHPEYHKEMWEKMQVALEYLASEKGLSRESRRAGNTNVLGNYRWAMRMAGERAKSSWRSGGRTPSWEGGPRGTR